MTTRLFLAAVLAFATAAPVAAATFHERDAANGDFSDVFDRPTVIGSDVRTVIGGQRRPMGHVQDVDFLKFEGFAEGVERLDFRITNPLGTWGGFNLRIKTEPFKNAGDWYPIVLHQQVTGVTDSAPQAFSFDIRDIDGPLYLAFDFFSADFTSGDGVRYEITQVGGTAERSTEVMPSPIPLPPAGALLLAGFGALGLLRGRKRRA